MITGLYALIALIMLADAIFFGRKSGDHVSTAMSLTFAALATAGAIYTGVFSG